VNWWALFRIALAIAIAFLVNYCVVSASEALLSRAFPPAPGTNLSDAIQLAAYVKSLPATAFLGLITGWLVGAIGAVTAAYLISDRMVALAWVAGAISLFGVVSTLFMLPHPLWAAVAGIAVPLVVSWTIPRVIGLPQRPPSARPD
jgi:hypothetical protein